MRVPKHIREKMHRLAELSQKTAQLSNEIDMWFVDRGFDIDELRCGNGYSLEELEYGNDVTDRFCAEVENGEYGGGVK